MAAIPATHDPASDDYNAAVTLLSNGDYTGAIELFDRALATNNTTSLKITDALLYTYQGKAFAQMQLGNYSDAIVTIDAGLAEYPTDKMLWNNKGYAQYNLGKYAEAVTSYDQALKSDVNYTKAWSNKGDAQVKLGKYSDAGTSYKAALALNPDDPQISGKLADAEKSAASAQQTMLVVLALVVVIVVAGVAYYILKNKQVDQKEEPGTTDKKAGTKKNKK
ncbi:MAG TPA: tetratricopeptide repeat protein [Methanoregula sp.]|nr:tetratricopeptide repeat protein [Methanoregula sp.]